MAFDFTAFLDSHRDRVDSFLKQHFDSIDCPAQLREAMVYSLDAGGKRIRPILTLATAEVVGGGLEAVLPIAVALECVHTYSLIHDDLPAMDDDDLRRGKPTNHKVFGEAKAILAGDGLLTEAFYLMSQASAGLAPETYLAIIQRVSAAAGCRGMVGGQLLDLQHENDTPTEELLRQIHTSKTGRLLTVAVEVGALAAGVSESELTVFSNYGFHLGYAFQIYDDVLDITGGAEIGKDPRSDLRQGKATFVALMGVEAATQAAHEEMQKAIAELAAFGERATPLIELARYIVTRKK